MGESLGGEADGFTKKGRGLGETGEEREGDRRGPGGSTQVH